MSDIKIHVFYGLNQTTKSADFFEIKFGGDVSQEGLLGVEFQKRIDEGNHPNSVHAVMRWTRSDGAACSARYKPQWVAPGCFVAQLHSQNLPPRSRRDGDNLGRRGSSVSRLLAEAHDFSEHQPIFVKSEISEPMRGIIADMLASDGMTPEEAWEHLVAQMRKESV